MSARKPPPTGIENYGGLLICAGLLAFAFLVNRSVAAAGASTP